MLRWQTEAPIKIDSLQEAAQKLSERVSTWTSKRTTQQLGHWEKREQLIFELVQQTIQGAKARLQTLLPMETIHLAQAQAASKTADSNRYTPYVEQYATANNYLFHKQRPQSWVNLQFVLQQDMHYELVITIHRFSYDDSVLAVGGLLLYQSTDQ